MKNNINTGDLAFLPSDLTLLQFSTDNSFTSPQRWVRTSKPAHVLFLGEQNDTPYCLVLYNGETWSVPRHEIYPIGEQQA